MPAQPHWTQEQKGTHPPSTLIVDDHPIVRQGCLLMLEQAGVLSKEGASEIALLLVRRIHTAGSECYADQPVTAA